jgi:hypothetical protein
MRSGLSGFVVASIWMASAALSGCGTDGARYTLDAVVALSEPTNSPPTELAVSLQVNWSDDGVLSLSPGGADSRTTSSTGSVPVGPLTPTGDPTIHQLTLVLDSEQPDDGEDPISAVATVRDPTRPTGGFFTGSVRKHEVGEEADGWIPVAMSVRSDVTSSL